jgi:hypothetical protein
LQGIKGFNEFGHPPLIREIAAMPLLLMDLVFPHDVEFWLEKQIFQILYMHGYEIERIIFWGRVPIVMLSILLGVYVWRWARELYGRGAGLCALAFYCFSPNILAHSRLVTIDLGSSCFIFIAMYYFWKFMEESTKRNLIIAGMTFGLAQLSKFTGLFLIPIYVCTGLIAIHYRKRMEVKFSIPFARFFSASGVYGKSIFNLGVSVAVIFIIGFLVVGVGYECIGIRFGDSVSISRVISTYLRELHYVLSHNKIGHPAFLMGRYSTQGWWYYLVVAFLIKTPIPTLIFLAWSIFAFSRIRHNDLAQEYFVLFPVVFIFLISLTNRVNIGLRYILPIYPFIFVCISKVMKVKVKRQRIAQMVMIVLGLWYITGCFAIYPDYLAYFNELVGGPDNGYKYLVDSNLDWGQDLKGLKRYMEAHNIEKVKLSYFGTADPAWYGIAYSYLPSPFSPFLRPSGDDFPSSGPTTGIMAVSATYLQNVYFERFKQKRPYRWLKDYSPVDKIGYSIFVYTMDSMSKPRV